MLLALAMSLLNACTGANSSPGCVCPPIKEYSKEFQRKLAKEIKASSKDAAFPVALTDYGALRLQLDVCKAY